MPCDKKIPAWYVCMYVCMYVSYVCMYVCMYVHTCYVLIKPPMPIQHTYVCMYVCNVCIFFRKGKVQAV